MKKRLLSILLTACLALTLCTGLSGTLLAKAADESSIHINDIVQVKVGDSLTDLKVYRNGVYEAMVPVEAGTYTAKVFINGVETDMTTTFTADADGEVCLRVKDNALTKVEIQSCALVGNLVILSFVNEAGEPFSIEDWEPADPNAELTYLGGGLYGRTFLFQSPTEDLTTLVGSYKVAFNDNWDYSIDDGSDNPDLAIPAGSSSLTVLVDEINQVVYDSVRSGSFSVAQDSSTIEKPALATTVSLIGDARCKEADNWIVDAKGYEFDLISDTLYRYEKTLGEGTYLYKCVFDYESWYAANRSFDLTEKTHVVFLYDTDTGRLYDTVNDYNTVAELIGMQAPPAQTKVSAKYLDETGEEQTAFCDAAITADNLLADLGEAGKTTWYVVQGDVAFGTGETYQRVNTKGDVHLILEDGCNLTLAEGLTALGDLTIYAQSTGDVQGSMCAYETDKDFGSIGIFVGGNFTINGGIIEAGGGKAGRNSYGIKAYNMTVNGGSVTATSSGANSSAGIYVEVNGDDSGTMTISGGSVTATGGPTMYNSCGIAAEKELIIEGGSVEAKGGDTPKIEGVTLTNCSIGICSPKVTIEGGTVEATGGDANTLSVGIYAAELDETGGYMVISGQAKVTAIGGEATTSYGIYVDDTDSVSITISGGHVTAQTLAETATAKAALSKEPDLGEYSGYYWRTDAEDSYTKGNFSWNNNPYDTYVEITDTPAYTITLNATGGTVETSALTTGEGWKLTGNLPTPTRDGYTFDGWFTAATGGDEVTTATVFDKDTTIYAHWTIKTYTITLNVNGGTVEPLTLTTGDGWKLTSLPVPTRDGYTFDGWFTAATGGDEVTNQTVFKRNTTIYAHWTINQYTIIFDTDGGSEIAPITQDYGTDVTAPENPTKTGYAFAGWEPEIPGTMPAEDMTITAKWTKNSSGGGVSTYAITVESTENGTVTMTPKSASKGSTVTLTVTPDKGYTLETLTVTNASGKEVKLTEKNGKYTFTMPGSKVTVKATFMEDNSMLNFFVDVPADAYYYDAVLWAAENGITGGVDDTHFAPNAPCTRAQIVTFLWRAAGCPEPESVSSFADVPADSYYAKAVAWAVENGITTGSGDGMFSPNATCTRAQAMTFIWRSQKSVAAAGANPFTDVAADAYYAGAVQWAVENGVTNGTSETTFSPNTNCTRAQIVTFLYRCLGEE